jgi:hypothetical protein
MKKLLLSAIVLVAMSCSSNNDESSSSESTNTITTDCNCGKIVRSGVFSIVTTPGSPTSTTTFTSYVVLNNCSNLERTYQVSGSHQSTYPVGKYICN